MSRRFRCDACFDGLGPQGTASLMESCDFVDGVLVRGSVPGWRQQQLVPFLALGGGQMHIRGSSGDLPTPSRIFQKRPISGQHAPHKKPLPRLLWLVISGHRINLHFQFARQRPTSSSLPAMGNRRQVIHEPQTQRPIFVPVRLQRAARLPRTDKGASMRQEPAHAAAGGRSLEDGGLPPFGSPH
jgi:hypothetical protein